MTKQPQAEGEEGSASGVSSAPYEGLLVQVASRIRSEPLLFIIAIAALLVALGLAAGNRGSSEVQLIAVIVGVLAFIGILAYYFMAGGRQTKSSHEPSGRTGRVTGKVRAGELVDEAQLKGVDAQTLPPSGADVQGEVRVKKSSGKAKATGVELGSGSSDTSPPDVGG